MALTFGFYNSVDGDRVYNAAQMSQIFDGLLTDGVFETIGTKLAVRPGTGLKVLIGVGRAWFNNTWTYNDTEMSIDIDAPDMLMDRIDAVVLEINSTNSVRANAIKVLKGTPASMPARPELTNTMFVHQYPLAYISVKVGAVEFAANDITSMIGTPDCPYISLANAATGGDVDAGSSPTKMVTPKSLAESSLVPFASPSVVGNILMSDGQHWQSVANDGWIPDLSVWSSANALTSRAFTNDPAAGASIALTMPDTSGFNKGDMLLAQSDQGTELTLALSVAANVSVTALYLEQNHSTVNRLLTAIKPTAVVDVQGDKTSLIQAGDRVRLVQNGITKYFIVVAVGAYSGGVTQLTLFTGPDVANGYNNYLNNAPISNVYFSHRKAPAGFPKKADRWAYEIDFKGGTFTQGSPTLASWYNVGGLGLLIPTGVYRLSYKVSMGLNYGATAGAVTWTSISTVASGAAAELFPALTWCMANQSTGAYLNGCAYGQGLLSPAAETLHYLIERVSLYNSVALVLNRDATFKSLIRFESAYL